VLRELINWPVSIARAAIDVPRRMERSIREANDLMEVSREQLESMRRQADQALEQAEKMNELLARVVKLTEPLERAQRGGEYVAGGLKRAIFGDELVRGGSAGEAEEPPVSRGAAEETALDAEEEALDAEEAAADAGETEAER
jgi:hypothetical protein